MDNLDYFSFHAGARIVVTSGDAWVELEYSHTASRAGYTHVADIGRLVRMDGPRGCTHALLLGRHRGSTRYRSLAFYRPVRTSETEAR